MNAQTTCSCCTPAGELDTESEDGEAATCSCGCDCCGPADESGPDSDETAARDETARHPA